MYCSKCGKPVDDNDRFCWSCGAEVKKVTENPTPEHDETEDAQHRTAEGASSVHVTSDDDTKGSVPHRISTDEFVWNIHEFHRPAQRPEKVYVDWASGKVIEVDAFGNRLDAAGTKEDASENRDAEKSEEEKPAEQHPAEPKAADHTVKTVRAEAERIAGPDPRAEITSEAKAEDVPVTIDDITKDIEKSEESNAALKRATARIDKFYTFNHKNEEFQKLLDKEYERVHGTVPPDTAQIFLEFERLTNPDFQEPEAAPEEKEERGAETASKREEAASEAPVADRDIHIPQETDIAAEKEAEEGTGFDPVAHLKEATAARQAELAKAGILDNDTIIQRFDTMQLEKDLMDETNTAEDASKKKGHRTAVLDELFGEIGPEQGPGPATEIALDAQLDFIAQVPADSGTPVAEAQAPTKAAAQAELDAQLGFVADARTDAEEEEGAKISGEMPQDDAQAIAADIAHEATEAAVQDGQTPPAVPQAGDAPPADEKPEKSQEKVDIFFDQPAPEEPKGGAGKIVGRTILVIAALLLIVCLTAIGIRQFAPDSTAGRFIDETYTALTAKMGFADGKTDPGEAEDTDGDIPSMMTGQEIIAAQIGNNKNIESIVYDPNIGYDASKDYGNDDLNSSVGLAQKYPLTVDYNKNASAIVGTLIAFDSQWVDYVNTKDKAVFALLKPDSNAHRNCSAYNKAGLVEKYFKELHLGDIRAGAEGYYVWADEKIVTVEKGKRTEENFSWIYYLESDGTSLRLVDYMRDKG